MVVGHVPVGHHGGAPAGQERRDRLARAVEQARADPHLVSPGPQPHWNRAAHAVWAPSTCRVRAASTASTAS